MTGSKTKKQSRVIDACGCIKLIYGAIIKIIIMYQKGIKTIYHDVVKKDGAAADDDDTFNEISTRNNANAKGKRTIVD